MSIWNDASRVSCDSLDISIRMMPLPASFDWTWITKSLELSMPCTLLYHKLVSCTRSQWVTNSVSVWPFELIPNAQLGITKTVSSVRLLEHDAAGHMICSILYLVKRLCPCIPYTLNPVEQCLLAIPCTSLWRLTAESLTENASLGAEQV